MSSSWKDFFRSIWPGTILIIAVTILLCLPGKALPSRSWFDDIYLDKWVHLFLFAALVVLWSGPIISLKGAQKKIYSTALCTSLLAFFYGILMEGVQHFWIPDRSFDLFDIVSDGAGCTIGFFVTVTWLAKHLGA